MDLFSLKVFMTVANEKNFTRAAEKLLRTQPAVSLSVQRLEDEIGEKLIEMESKVIPLLLAPPTTKTCPFVNSVAV